MTRFQHSAALLFAFAFAWMPPAEAGLVFTIEQSGGDVVVTGSGSLDTSGLGAPANPTVSAEMEPSLPHLVVGFDGGAIDGFNAFNFFTGSADFGTGLLAAADSASGDLMGFQVLAGDMLLFVPPGYGSNTPLSGTATWATETFASLGITPGSYLWTLDANSDTIAINVVPEPATAALLLSSVTALGYVAVRRRLHVSR